MSRFFFGVPLALLVLGLVGCATTQRIDNVQGEPHTLARLKVKTEVGSGDGKKVAQIVTVDGDRVGKWASHVLLSPGTHIFQFTFTQTVKEGTSGITFQTDIFGAKGKHHTGTPSTIVRVPEPITRLMVFEAGKSYRMSIDGLNFVPDRYTKMMEAAGLQGTYTLRGFMIVKEE